MRMSSGLCMLMLLSPGAVVAQEPEDPVIAQVLQRDEELASAHGRGDIAAYRAGLSTRYVYIDVSGARVTADVLESRRGKDHRRVVSSDTSEQEAVRLAADVVLLRGLDHSVASYFGGLPRVSTTRWTALWVRENDGVWRLTADTATPVKASQALAFIAAPQPDATLQALAGRWALALDPAMELVLVVESGKLVGTLVGQDAKFVFAPVSATHYFAEERPFELRFAADGKSLAMVTWGTPTQAIRIGD